MKRRFLVIAPLLCSPLGCLSWSQVDGSVVTEGTKMGTWTRSFPTGCRSGAYEDFQGADLFGDGIQMRVMRDDRQRPVVHVTDTDRRVRFEATREVCSTLDVQVKNRGLDGPGDGSRIEGRATLACTPKTGGTVRGSVSFLCADGPGESAGAVHATLAVEGTVAGAWEPVLSSCKSGAWQGYLGAEFSGPGTAMKIVVDPLQGPTIVLQQHPSNDTFTLTREKCPVLDVHAARGANPDDGAVSPLVEGTANFSCDMKTGGNVRGSVRFRCW